MSQDVSTNQKSRESSVDSIPIHPWSIETYADQLMDELFGDVDRSLDGSGKLPSEPAKPDYVSLKPLVIPPLKQTAEPLVAPEQRSPQSGDMSVVADSVPVNKAAKPRRASQPFDKLLLGAACASLVVALILWLVSQQGIKWLFPANSGSSSVANKLAENPDRQFIGYMQRALHVIDRKAQANKQQSSLPGGAQGSATSLPPVPVPNTTAEVPYGGVPKILERVYIPVYQPPPASYSSPATTPPSPSSTRQQPAAKTSAKAPSVSLQPSPPSSRRTPNTSIPTPAAQSPKPSAPSAPAAPAAPAPAAQDPVASAPAAPSAQLKLLGVIDMGDQRSAALFEINGVTQRIQLGESIGSSGWTLVAVANQEAIIRRNGEVRSVYAGDQF